jgi:hypothetical protein
MLILEVISDYNFLLKFVAVTMIYGRVWLHWQDYYYCGIRSYCLLLKFWEAAIRSTLEIAERVV